MIKYLTKQFGMTALALAILVTGANVTQAVDGFKLALKHNTKSVEKINACQIKISDLVKPAVYRKGN